MKIISVAVFALALGGTWVMAYAKKPVSQSVHMDIQNDLKRIIAEKLQKNVPESKNLRFEKFWTETVNKDKVKAYFVYTYDDVTDEGEPAEVQIDGSAILNKVEETAENSTWSFDSIQVLDTKVSFNEPIQITSRAGELENAQPQQAPASPQPEHKEQH
jgi:hypothetical protein